MSDDFDDNGSSGDSGCVWMFLLLGGILCLIISGACGFSDLRYKMGGKAAEATVVQGPQADGETGGQYQFTVGDKQYTGYAAMAPQGQVVAMEYLTSNPNTNRLNGSSDWIPGGLIFLLISIPMIIAGVVIFKSNDDLMAD